MTSDPTRSRSVEGNPMPDQATDVVTIWIHTHAKNAKQVGGGCRGAVVQAGYIGLQRFSFDVRKICTGAFDLLGWIERFEGQEASRPPLSQPSSSLIVSNGAMGKRT